MRDTSATDIILEKPKRRFGNRLIPAAVVVVLLLAVVFFTDLLSILGTEQNYPRDRVRIANVTKGDFEHSISAEGKLAAVVEPTLFAPSEGRISLLVKPGDKVSKGQKLASIENPLLESEYKTTVSDFEREKIQAERFRLDTNLQTKETEQGLKLAKIRYEAAKRKLARYTTEDAQLAISQQDFEAAQDELLVAEAEYTNLQATSVLLKEKLQFDIKAKQLELEQQQHLVEEIKRKVNELTILSPIEGQIGTFHVKEKDSVEANQPLMNVVDLSVFGVEIAIPESYANDLEIGMPVVINYEGQNYPGELISISPEVNNSTIEARAVFQETPNGRLRQNQRVSLKVLLRFIPDSLIAQRGPFLESGSGRYAYVVDGNVATQTPIQIGAISTSEVEIISGLTVDNQIIISDTSIFNNSPTVLLR